MLLAACGTSEPGPAESRIVFTAFELPRINLFSMAADGSDLRRLTNGDTLRQFPSWSPGARAIVFHSVPLGEFKREIYIMESNGSGMRKLSTGDSDDSEPEWSPDGSRIAFSSLPLDGNGNPAGEQRIWVMHPDGSNRTPLAPGFAPSWSPDGSRLVFVRGLGGQETALFVMASDGSGATQITDPRPDADQDQYPEWSPDGEYIAFSRLQFSQTVPATLMLVRPDGSGLLALSRPLIQGYQPSWSPDGSEIVFSDGGDGQLKIISLADPAAIRLLGQGPSEFNESPNWSREH
ncbi:MAG TPA: hypothetical protein VFH24_07580 [Gemmatimonadales bacterium]|nr:hypothetical protein [Gemmatimonadales bacterium]